MENEKERVDSSVDPNQVIDEELNEINSIDSPEKLSPDRENFFNRLRSGLKKNDRLKDWTYTLGIFFLVTLILTLPFYFMMSTEALLLLPAMVLMGFIVALFTAYIFTPFGLRHFKQYLDDPVIQGYVEELSNKAEIRTPKILVAETPELNAMVFCSIFGGRLCLTRGLLDEYHHGDFTDDELRAIIGHEIGHLKNGDCFKWSFVLSWISIFDLFGTVLLVLGGAFIATGAVTTVLSDRDNSGPLLSLMGVFMVIAGVIQRLISKVASIPALHLSRTHEYAADLAGAQLTGHDVFISALQKMDLHNNQLSAKNLAQLPFSDRWQAEPRNMSWIDGLFSTHPPIEKRVSSLELFRNNQSLIQGSPQKTEQNVPVQSTSRHLYADKTVSSTSPPVTGATEITEKNYDLYETLLPEPGSGHEETSESLIGKIFIKKKVISAVAILVILLIGILLIIPPLVQSTPNFLTSAVTTNSAPSPVPTIQAATQYSSIPTSVPTTQVTTIVTPLSLGQSAMVTLPYSETLQFNYNTIHRYFTSPNTATLAYDIIVDQVTEVKEISSASGYSTKIVTRNDPNAYLLIKIWDTQSGNIIATTGFGKTYSSSPHQELIIRKTGNLELELTGAKVDVDLVLT